MSDALCGPSNALQNFQKHASVDRTLQQDRLISRRSPSQGFRSQNFNDGILDPEFAAFESNLAGTPLPDLQNPAHFLTPSPHFAVHNHAEDHNWATDFQNLQISGPSPLAHQQASMASASAPTLAQHVNSSPSVQNMTTSQLLPTEAFDESAFEAAFEQARADLASQTADHTQEVTHEITQLDNTATSQAQEPIRIGSDTILQPVKDDARVHLNDADELARTAGQLLESVSHDHSRKFRESNFLALMRRIRDREVHIEGDEFRESSQPLHPGGKYYPEGKTHTQQEQSPSMMTKNHNERRYVESVYGDSIHPLPMVTEDETPNIASHADIVNGLGTGGEDQSLHESWMFGDRWA
ncbi:protein pex20 [Aspergillus alliaceus]|uniref:protein pex20 n=1 Tax=Petromyces alliaceus TaxID=209559 RepID=UPI0012A6812F|nr:uncharacterized protein BDW43DRAFT_303858 [Aspergillus alliaceus]KAB8228503.1 hypothetical protein BDW43DRAFT_303858 [Aspergillus alliaceus]